MPKALDIQGIARGGEIQFTFDGRTIHCFEGESIAAALMRDGVVATRCTTYRNEPRGYYCGMGVCWECAVDVAGIGIVRGCLHTATEGAVVTMAAVVKR